MIRITITLVPFGRFSEAKVLRTVDIANDGTGTLARGNYKARVSRGNHMPEEWSENVVRDYPRRSKNVLHLLSRVLHNLGYK